MPEPSLATLRRRIDALKRQIVALGPLRPGTLSLQYNVCGNPTCRCKADPPQKHGPYHQLSYTWHRQSRTHFVREEDLPQIQREVATYAQLRALVDAWIATALEMARRERQQRRVPLGKSPTKPRQSRTPKPRRS